jgi:hypothetical protein
MTVIDEGFLFLLQNGTVCLAEIIELVMPENRAIERRNRSDCKL